MDRETHHQRQQHERDRSGVDEPEHGKREHSHDDGAHQERRAAPPPVAQPLGADPESLHQPNADEQDRCPDADLRVRRQHTDREGGQSHHDHGPDQWWLASEPVAEVPGDEPADGTGEKPHGERGERRERARHSAELGEEQVAEDQRGSRRVDQEVEPLQPGRQDRGRSEPRHLPIRAVLHGHAATSDRVRTIVQNLDSSLPVGKERIRPIRPAERTARSGPRQADADVRTSRPCTRKLPPRQLAHQGQALRR